MNVAVALPFHSLFYAPHFVAVHAGCFADEGLDVRTLTGPAGTIRHLADGTAHFALGGLMRSLDVVDRGGRAFPHFVEVNSRNGFFLFSRTPRPDFAWATLAGRTVISFAGAPTPWQCMQAVLRRHGVDPARVTFVRTLHGADAVAAFRVGAGDFLEVGEPAAEALVDAGLHLVASMGEATGPVPFSSYMTTADRLRRDRALVAAFTRAAVRALRWVARHDADTIAECIAPSFADVPERWRRRAVARYREQGTWATDPTVTRSGYDYLQDILLAGGFIKRRHRYEELVDTAYATAAWEEVEDDR
jgi:NitT/TauT family transport system substrate-binding protein